MEPDVLRNDNGTNIWYVAFVNDRKKEYISIVYNGDLIFLILLLVYPATTCNPSFFGEIGKTTWAMQIKKKNDNMLAFRKPCNKVNV